ncbi:MAG: HesA/MoeB/ThiF family protein [Desulfomonilaceae bacterium]
MEPQIPRYSRHQLLRVIGKDGQQKIRESRVLIAGLGALGSLISILLVRAGVGFVRIADQDCPELHNLHRQILYEEEDALRCISKAQAAANRLRASNSDVEIQAVEAAIARDNVEELTQNVDLVVDALDNIRTRYLINDVILNRGIPYIFGGAVETVGNVMTIIPGRTPCLRCLWPDPGAVDNHPRASAVGVLSAVATAVASFQVTEALKIMVGREEDILSGLLVFDVWRNDFHIAPLERDPGCICSRLNGNR